MCIIESLKKLQDPELKNEGWTIVKIAEASGISKSQIGLLIRDGVDANPRLKTALKVQNFIKRNLKESTED